MARTSSTRDKKMKKMYNWLFQFRNIWETKFNQLDKVLATIKEENN